MHSTHRWSCAITHNRDPWTPGRQPQVGLSAAFDCLMRMLGPCLVVLAVLLIGSVAFLYFGYLLPLLVARDAAGGRLQSSSLRFLHGAWATFLLFNVLFNYAACVLTPPGGLEQEQPRQGQCRGQGQESAAAAAAVYEHEEEGVSYALGASAANGGAGMGQQHHGSSCIAGGVDPRTYGFCKKCRFPRPPRYMSMVRSRASVPCCLWLLDHVRVGA